MDRMLLWGIGLGILIFLAFVPICFSIEIKAGQLTFGLRGTSGTRCELAWVSARSPVSIAPPGGSV